jgi:tetratricopeptide (TPR) repeat protein
MKSQLFILVFLTFFGCSLDSNLLFAQPGAAKSKTKPENTTASGVDAADARKGKRTDVLLVEYEKMVKENPKDFEAMYGKASCELLLKRPKSALYSLHQTVKVQPNYAPAYALMGKILKNLNKIDSAAICYELAAQYETDNNKKVEYKGFAIMKLIKEKKTEEAYKKVKEIYPLALTNKQVVYFYARMSNQFSQHEEAKNSIKKIEADLAGMDIRESAKYYYELGFALYQLQQFGESKLVLQKINFGPFKRKVDKLSAPYFYHLGTLYARFHEDGVASTHLDQALTIDKDFTKAHLLKAQLSRRGQDVNETSGHMTDAIKNQTDPLKKLMLYDKLAEVQLDAGDYEGSMNTLSQALKLKLGKGGNSKDRIDPNTWFLMCLAQYKLGNHKEAIKSIDEFLNKKIPSPTAMMGSFFILKGLAAKNTSDYIVASEAFKSAMKTPMKDVAEIEITILRQMKKMEKDDGQEEDTE